jgi:hypothetical protein
MAGSRPVDPAPRIADFTAAVDDRAGVALKTPRETATALLAAGNEVVETAARRVRARAATVLFGPEIPPAEPPRGAADRRAARAALRRPVAAVHGRAAPAG